MIAVNSQVGNRYDHNGLAARQSNGTCHTTLVAQIQHRIDLHGIIHFDVGPLRAHGVDQRRRRVSSNRQVFVQCRDQRTGFFFIVDHDSYSVTQDG